jgi:hypothetical protein
MYRWILCAAAVAAGLVLAVPESFGRGHGGGHSGHHGHHGHSHWHHGHHWHNHWHHGNYGHNHWHHGHYWNHRHYGYGWGPSQANYWYTPVAVPVGETAAEEAPTVQSTRYLRVKNRTAEPITVRLFYRTWTNKDRFRWYPADPSAATEPLRMELAPGAESTLVHDGWQVHASRVRLWAVAAGGREWDNHRDKDLWLVPAQTDGWRYYYGPMAETYTFSFSP